MPTNDFALSVNVNLVSFEGTIMAAKLLTKRSQRVKIKNLQKAILSVERMDAKPVPKSSKTGTKIKVFDPAITGMTDSVTKLKNRCVDLLAKQA